MGKNILDADGAFPVGSSDVNSSEGVQNLHDLLPGCLGATLQLEIFFQQLLVVGPQLGTSRLLIAVVDQFHSSASQNHISSVNSSS